MDDDSQKELTEKIRRYQEGLDRNVHRRDDEKILYYIKKLDQLPITVAHLEQTGVGRTINKLKRYGNTVTESSNDLVAKWKEMVVQEGQSEQGTSEDKTAKPHDSPKNEPASPAPPVIENMLHDVGNYEYQNGDELDFDETDDSFEDDDETDSGNESADMVEDMVEDVVEDVVEEPYQQLRENASNEGSAFDSHEEPSSSRKRKSEYSDAGSDPGGKRSKGNDSSRSGRQDESSSKHSSSHSTDDHKSKSKDERERGESSKGSHHSHKNKDHSRSSNNRRDSSSEDECHEDSKQTKNKTHSSHHSKGTTSKHTKYESSDDQEKHSEEESPSRHHQSSSSRHSKDKSTDAKHKKHNNAELKHSSTERKHSSKDEKHKTEKSDAQIDSKDSSSSKNDKHRPKSNKDTSDRDNKHKSKHEKHASSDSKTDSKQQKHSLKTEKSSSKDHKKDLKHELKEDRHTKTDKHNVKENKSNSKNGEHNSKDRKYASKEDKDNSKDSKHSSKSDRRTSKDDKSSSKSEKHNSISPKVEKQASSDSKSKDSERKNKSTESSSSEKKGKTKEKSKSSKVSTQKRALIDSIDSGSGASFAEALGMCVPVIGKTNKKKTPIGDRSSIHADKASSSSEKPSSNLSMQNNDTDSDLPSLLKEPPPSMDPPDINITNLLPPITPNYRPLGITTVDNFQRKLTDDEALSKVITTKNQRTKVYSGNKTVWTKVPTLFDLCTRVLQDNLDALEYTGGVPYDILKPILEKATCHQLYMLEHHNPYIIDDSDELWKLHCMKDFKTKKREELESWRDMYMRCMDEREAKLRALTANIKQSQDKSLPVRTTKLAYVDDYVKPPRNVLRQQARHGTAHEKRPTITPAVRAATASTSKGSAAEEKVVVPNPGPRAAERSSQPQLKIKPKKAPLMAKALSDLKNRFRR